MRANGGVAVGHLAMRGAVALSVVLLSLVLAPAESRASACVAIGIGAATPANAAITPVGDEDCFTFTGAAVDRIRVRVVETSGSLFAVHEVRRPNGTTVCAPNNSTETSCDLDAAGTHKIMVRDLGGTNTGNYRIAVQRLNSPVGCTALTFGAAPTQSVITVAGEMDCFSFTGANLDDIRIRVINTAGTIAPATEVVRTDGTTKCGLDSAVDQTCVLDSGGGHRILVRDASGPQLGTYRIQIQRLNNPLSCPAILAGAATPAQGDIATKPEMDCWTYNATTAGQQLRVRVVETGASPTLFATIEVVRPNGTTVCAVNGSTEVTCALDTTGNHRIIVRDLSGQQTGNYRIAVQRLNSPVGCTALTFGAAPTQSVITVAGEMDCFSFTGANLDDIRIRVINTAGTIAPATEVVRTDGTTKCGLDSAVDQTCVLDSGGGHRILVRDASGPQLGTYRIQIQRLNNPLSCPAILAGAATPAQGDIATKPEMDCWTYNATTAGQKLRVRVVETGASPTLFATIEVVRPNGTTVCAVNGSTEVTCALDTTGNHRIIVRDLSGQQTGNYRIAVQRLNSPVGCTALTFGAAPTQSVITVAGEMDCFSFTGANLDDIRIRVINTAGTIAPATEVVRTDGTTKCGLDSAVDQTCVLDSGGGHRILVRDASGPQLGTYRIQIQRLNNPLSCPAILAGAATPAQGDIATKPEMDCWTYNATTAGQQLRVRVVETGASPTLFATIEVVRPNGTTVCAVNGSTEVTCALDTTGNHRIIVRDLSGQQTGNYRIAVQRLNSPVGCTALTFGAAPTQSVITVAGEMDCFSFTGANLDDIRIRVINTAGTIAPATEVVRTDGTTKCGLDSAVDQTCVLDSGGGHRILVRDAGGPQLGTYRIQIQRLNNPLTCPAISLGATGSAGDIATKPEMDCFTYNATTAGQKLRVRVAEKGASPTLFATIEVVRPNGTTVCAVNGSTEVNCDLDATGNHRIIVRDLTGQNTGTYGVSARRLNGTGSCEVLIEAASVIRPITEAAEQDCYAFTGQAGETYNIELAGLSGFDPSIEVLRPNGTTVCGPGDETLNSCAFDTTGTHQVIVRDRSAPGTDTGDYFLAVG